MASQPDKPESIVLSQFAGVRNTTSRERLTPADLVSATNVDIDDTGQVRRRRGYDLKLAGNCHSLRTIGGRTLVVKDGVLGLVGTNFTFTSLGATVGPDRLSYAQIKDTTYFSSRSASGKLTDTTVTAWGITGDDGEWVSPIQTPTDTLGEVFGRQITAPPLAEEITPYNGRIYLASGKYVWATELWMPDYVDPTRNFLQFEADITMLGSVSDGLYVGTETGLYFLRGTLSEGFRQDLVQDGAVVRGSMTEAPAAEVHPQARQGPMAEAIGLVCMTAQGICGCFDGGQVINLTRGRVVFPSAQSAAALYREDQGGSTYVAVTDSAGGPAANARVGDYADAEIVRAADR